jgi:hypothetical protein
MFRVRRGYVSRIAEEIPSPPPLPCSEIRQAKRCRWPFPWKSFFLTSRALSRFGDTCLGGQVARMRLDLFTNLARIIQIGPTPSADRLVVAAMRPNAIPILAPRTYFDRIRSLHWLILRVRCVV